MINQATARIEPAVSPDATDGIASQVLVGISPQSGTVSEGVIIVCAGSARINAFANLFRSAGFRVERVSELPPMANRDRFGAIVYLAHTYNELSCLLDDSPTDVSARDRIFMEGEDGDFHCSIQLTPNASYRLQNFVRSLWSVFNIT